MELSDRFWAKVRRGAGCWEWIAARSKYGYGQFSVGYSMRPAHRVAWALVHGPIPTGMHVLHRCDNPPCVNPDHLLLGTNEDNVRDRDRKGRGVRPKGERHGRSKLREKEVREILRFRANGLGATRIAADYGVAPCTIRRIVSGARWKHIAEAP